MFVSIGSVTGATVAFIIARYLARNWVAGKIEGNSSFKAMDEAVSREGWKIVLLTRLTPVFPFNIQNYGYVKRSAQALEDISPKGRMEAFDEEFDEDMVEADREDRVAPKLNVRILEDEEMEDIHDIEIKNSHKISG